MCWIEWEHSGKNPNKPNKSRTYRHAHRKPSEDPGISWEIPSEFLEKFSQRVGGSGLSETRFSKNLMTWRRTTAGPPTVVLARSVRKILSYIFLRHYCPCKPTHQISPCMLDVPSDDDLARRRARVLHRFYTTETLKPVLLWAGVWQPLCGTGRHGVGVAEGRHAGGEGGGGEGPRHSVPGQGAGSGDPGNAATAVVVSPLYLGTGLLYYRGKGVKVDCLW